MTTRNLSETAAFSVAERAERFDRIIPAPATAADAYHRFTVIEAIARIGGAV